MQYLIVGCGYLGQRVAQLLLSRGHAVHALTRSKENAERFRAMGLSPVVGDVMDPDLSLPVCHHLIHAVGFDRSANYSKREVYVAGLRNVLAKSVQTASVTYVSSTSVYGQSNGEWVDEDSETNPESEGGQICLDAERLIHNRDEYTVVRLAGLYGPDRLLRQMQALRENQPLPGNPDAFLNLVHVDDAAMAVAAAANEAAVASLFLVSDGNPPTRREFYTELNRLIGLPPPTFDASATTLRGSGGRNKRCRSARLHNLAGFRWQYPSFREGLPAAIPSRL